MSSVLSFLLGEDSNQVRELYAVMSLANGHLEDSRVRSVFEIVVPVAEVVIQAPEEQLRVAL
jgi:hypothetical protein